MNPAFIGRVAEIKKFKTALTNFSAVNPAVAFVYDAFEQEEDKGGIGKTWLLNQFVKTARAPEYADKFIVIDEIFDFHRPVYRDRLSRLSIFAKIVEQKTRTQAFEKFWIALKDYNAKSAVIEKVFATYYEGLTRFCNDTKKNIVLFLDTFEVAEKTLNYAATPHRFIEDHEKNIFFVISGRHAPNLQTPLWQGREKRLVPFPLKGFSHPEAREYFHRAGYVHLTEQQITALNTKAKGRPILLALIVDYLQNILKLDDILRLEESTFKQRLVEFIREFRNPPVAQAVLAMAHIKHRCDKAFLQRFVGPLNDFNAFYEKLKSLSFVRQLGNDYIVLHDEMQKMVSEYLLPAQFVFNALRRDFSAQAITFYSEHIQEAERFISKYREQNDFANEQVAKDEKFDLEAERWYHQIYFNYATNLKDLEPYFAGFYDSIFETGQFDACFILLDQLDDLQKLLNFEARDKNRVKIRQARVNREKFYLTGNQYYFEQAQQSFSELLTSARQSHEKLFLGTVLCDFGILYFYAHEDDRAESLLQESIAVLSIKDEVNEFDRLYYLGKSQNWMAYVIYNQGRFKASIAIMSEAEKIFTQAEADTKIVDETRMTQERKNIRSRQINDWLAQVRGNLCRIYREQGDFNQALRLGESSLSKRRALNNPREILKGLNSLGLVYERREEIHKALQYYREAETLLRNVPDPILESRILTNKATLLFKREAFSKLLEIHTRAALNEEKELIGVTSENRNEAREFLNKVISSLERTNARELAVAYNNLGELALLEDHYDEATTNFHRAAGISQSGKDSYTLMNSLQRLVLSAYLMKNDELWGEHQQTFTEVRAKLKSQDETARYYVRYLLTVGNYHFDKLFNGVNPENFNRHFQQAFQSFSDAIVYAQSGAPGKTQTARNVFTERLLELLKARKITPEHQKTLIQYWQQNRLETDELVAYFSF